MPPIKPRRTVLGIGLALLWLGLGSHPRPAEAEAPGPAEAEASDDAALKDEPPSTEGSGPQAGPQAGPDAEASAALEPSPAPPTAVEGPLRGRQGAATARAVRDPETALALLEAEPVPPEGSPQWCTHGALRGRALRMLGRPGDAVAELEPRLAREDLDECFPRDVLGVELALSRVEHAEDEATSAAQAEAQHQAAIDEL